MYLLDWFGWGGGLCHTITILFYRPFSFDDIVYLSALYGRMVGWFIEEKLIAICGGGQIPSVAPLLPFS